MDKRKQKAEYMRKYREINNEDIKRQNNEKYAALGYSKSFHDNLVSYGLTKLDYDIMLCEQDFKCAICRKHETRIDSYSKGTARLCIDHNHITGVVRALLCNACNVGIARFKDNPVLIEKAIAYLIKHAEAA